jgi:hypothetical protein
VIQFAMALHASLFAAALLLALRPHPASLQAETPAEEPKACKLITAEDAAMILGPKPNHRTQGNSCYYQGETMQLMFEMLDDPSHIVLSGFKTAMAGKGFAILDEPSLGKGAFSASRENVVIVKLPLKAGVLNIELLHKDGKIPPGGLDQVRTIAKRAMSR